MNTVFILVIWDRHDDGEGHAEWLPAVRQFEDSHDAIEALKDAKPIFQAHLYQCSPDGAWQEIKGW